VSATRTLQWATGLVVALTLAFEVHSYWIASPIATCGSAHDDTYLQERACTIAITFASIEGKPNVDYYINRGDAEETNCDLDAASGDYRRAVDLAPKSMRAPQLAREAADDVHEYCPRGENADRAEAVLLSGALLALPYALAALAVICGLFGLASRRLVTALLLTASSVSWLVVLFAIYTATMMLWWRPQFADYIPGWLEQETLFGIIVIIPLWCVLIASCLTFFARHTWPRGLAESVATH
jgi:hypothetical protein